MLQFSLPNNREREKTLRSQVTVVLLFEQISLILSHSQWENRRPSWTESSHTFSQDTCNYNYCTFTLLTLDSGSQHIREGAVSLVDHGLNNTSLNSALMAAKASNHLIPVQMADRCAAKVWTCAPWAVLNQLILSHHTVKWPLIALSLCLPCCVGVRRKINK